MGNLENIGNLVNMWISEKIGAGELQVHGEIGDTGSRRNMANFMTMGNSGSREIL
jgi:hypothetical protein